MPDAAELAQQLAQYRAFVAEVSSAAGPSQVILNRSPDHAAIVLEHLFRRAHRSVHIVTRKLSEEVYAKQGVPEAAAAFLHQNPDGEIHILAEEPITNGAHPFLAAVRAEAADRVRVVFVPSRVRDRYAFNFAVADGASYRFEENRDLREAMIRFGDEVFGARLETIFQDICRQTTADQPA